MERGQQQPCGWGSGGESVKQIVCGHILTTCARAFFPFSPFHICDHGEESGGVATQGKKEFPLKWRADIGHRHERNTLCGLIYAYSLFHSWSEAACAEVPSCDLVLRPCRPSTAVSRPSGPKTAKKSPKKSSRAFQRGVSKKSQKVEKCL